MAKAAGSLYFLCDTTKNHQMNGPVITEVSTGATTQCILNSKMRIEFHVTITEMERFDELLEKYLIQIS